MIIAVKVDGSLELETLSEQEAASLVHLVPKLHLFIVEPI